VHNGPGAIRKRHHRAQIGFIKRRMLQQFFADAAFFLFKNNGV
jgi:hypothetical protein